MEEVLVFVDEGFLALVSKYFGGGAHVKFDKIKFVKLLSERENLIFKHLFYYTAPPFQNARSSEKENKMRENYDKFVKSLNKNKEITIREGRCQRVKEDGKFVYRQKGVDTLLTIDLMTVPLEHSKIKEIILIASDSDFVPVINRLKKIGINTTLYTYFDRKRNSSFSTSNELLKAVKKYVQLEEKDFHDSKY